jgi:hypothetical protein
MSAVTRLLTPQRTNRAPLRAHHTTERISRGQSCARAETEVHHVTDAGHPPCLKQPGDTPVKQRKQPGTPDTSRPIHWSRGATITIRRTTTGCKGGNKHIKNRLRTDRPQRRRHGSSRDFGRSKVSYPRKSRTSSTDESTGLTAPFAHPQTLSMQCYLCSDGVQSVTVRLRVPSALSRRSGILAWSS